MKFNIRTGSETELTTDSKGVISTLHEILGEIFWFYCFSVIETKTVTTKIKVLDTRSWSNTVKKSSQSNIVLIAKPSIRRWALIGLTWNLRSCWNNASSIRICLILHNCIISNSAAQIVIALIFRFYSWECSPISLKRQKRIKILTIRYLSLNRNSKLPTDSDLSLFSAGIYIFNSLQTYFRNSLLQKIIICYLTITEWIRWFLPEWASTHNVINVLIQKFVDFITDHLKCIFY